MVSQYARYMKGGYSIPQLLELKPNEFLFWYRIMEREIIEESILSKRKPDASPLEGKALERAIDVEIKKRRRIANGEHE